MACQIAHWCPGFGDPWNKTLGEWMRIMERIPDLQDAFRQNLRAATAGDPLMDGAMRMARHAKRRRKLQVKHAG